MAYFGSNSYYTGISRPASFPSYAIKPIGIPVLTEADWNYGTLPNSKFGGFLSGTSSLARETTNLLWGGAGSCKMLTDATISHTAEVKTAIQSILKQGDLLAFEMKWTQQFAFGNTAIHFGLESRDANNIVHSRFRWTPSFGKWQMENADTSFGDFPASVGGALPITKPTVDVNVGNIIGWARCVIDPFLKTYVGFEAGGFSTKLETRDMRSLGLPLVIEGSSGGNPLYLPFVLIFSGGNGAEPGYTTDWVISRIPQGINPF